MKDFFPPFVSEDEIRSMHAAGVGLRAAQDARDQQWFAWLNERSHVHKALKRVDWTMLRAQKAAMVAMAQEDRRTAEINILNGIVHFLDGLQNVVVKDEIASENDVFGPMGPADLEWLQLGKEVYLSSLSKLEQAPGYYEVVELPVLAEDPDYPRDTSVTLKDRMGKEFFVELGSLAPHAPLKPYRIEVQDNCAEPETFIFECMAEGVKHAEWQADCAYPGYEIRSTTMLYPELLRFVVYSPNEAQNDGAGFWSNYFGWTEEQDADSFTLNEVNQFSLPISTGDDARFVIQRA